MHLGLDFFELFAKHGHVFTLVFSVWCFLFHTGSSFVINSDSQRYRTWPNGIVNFILPPNEYSEFHSQIFLSKCYLKKPVHCVYTCVIRCSRGRSHTPGHAADPERHGWMCSLSGSLSTNDAQSSLHGHHTQRRTFWVRQPSERVPTCDCGRYIHLLKTKIFSLQTGRAVLLCLSWDGS